MILMTFTSEEWDTRIPYRLGTDNYCKFENCDEYVRMGDLVEVGEDRYDGPVLYTGELLYVEYGNDGFISLVSITSQSDEYECINVDCDGVFFKPESEVNCD